MSLTLHIINSNLSGSTWDIHKSALNLVLETSQSTTNDGRNNTQRNQNQPSHGSRTQTNKWNLSSTGEQVCIQSSERSSGKVKGGRPNLQSTSNNRQQKGSALNSQGGDPIDQKLLIVRNEGENTGFLEDWKEFLRLLEGEAKVLELGEDAEFRGFFEKA